MHGDSASLSFVMELNQVAEGDSEGDFWILAMAKESTQGILRPISEDGINLFTFSILSRRKRRESYKKNPRVQEKREDPFIEHLLDTHCWALPDLSHGELLPPFLQGICWLNIVLREWIIAK